MSDPGKKAATWLSTRDWKAAKLAASGSNQTLGGFINSAIVAHARKTLADLSQHPTSEIHWRPEVKAFADLMEAQLRANDHKPGWKGEDCWPLMYRMREETLELHEVLMPGSRGDLPAWQRRVACEAADVANFAMMIADVCGALDPRHIFPDLADDGTTPT